MCRANRRCEQHWTEERRAADNARRRAIYAANKGGKVRTYVKQKEKDIITPKTSPFLQTLKTNPFFLNNEDPRIEITERLAEAVQHLHIASGEVEKIDRNFTTDGSNSVERVLYKDGTVGYYKSYDDNLFPANYKDFGHTAVGVMNNEVTAYLLSKALGGPFDGLVPETAICVIDGKVGSVQKEADGIPYEMWLTKNEDTIDYRTAIYEFPESKRRAAAIFDYITGSQDRHTGNILVSEEEMLPVLIDNGYCFPETDNFSVNAHSEFIINIEERGHDPLTDAEKNTLQEIYDSPDGKGMKKFMSEDSYNSFRGRVKFMLEKGRLLEVERHNSDIAEFSDGWYEGGPDWPEYYNN